MTHKTHARFGAGSGQLSVFDMIEEFRATFADRLVLAKNAKGRPVKAVLPYRAYRELVKLKISQEIYEQPEAQDAIRSARRDIAEGRVRRFKILTEALRWLDK